MLISNIASCFKLHCVFLIIVVAVKNAQTLAICGETICQGITAYCCPVDESECCWGSWYDVWWLWMLLTVLVTLVICSLLCCCRRPYEMRYVLVENVSPPTYGSTVSYPPQPPPMVAKMDRN